MSEHSFESDQSEAYAEVPASPNEPISLGAIQTATTTALSLFNNVATEPQPPTVRPSRQPEAETPFLAPAKSMTDPDLVMHFLKGDQAQQTAYIRRVCTDIMFALKAEQESGRSMYKLPSQIHRGMSLMVHLANYYKSQKLEDPHSEEMISKTLGLYIQRMHPYIRRLAEPLTSENSTFTLGDLISEGNIGLVEALGRYDLGQDTVGLFDYVKPRIRGAMVDAIRKNDNMIRISRIDVVRSKRFWEMSAEGRTLEEIAEFLDVAPWRLERSLANYTTTQTTTIDRMTSIPSHSGAEVLTLADEIPNSDKSVEDQAIENCATPVSLDELLRPLSERNREVMRMRFGLHPYEKRYKVHEIGECLGFTESRASQIVTESLKILRSVTDTNIRIED
jgi:RNA polymerase primary sigma factor